MGKQILAQFFQQVIFCIEMCVERSSADIRFINDILNDDLSARAKGK